MSKMELLDRVRALVADVTRARFAGGAYAKLARAHGYVDGYMRALIETGVATRKELLELVAQARTRVDGPATRVVEPESDYALTG